MYFFGIIKINITHIRVNECIVRIQYLFTFQCVCLLLLRYAVIFEDKHKSQNVNQRIWLPCYRRALLITFLYCFRSIFYQNSISLEMIF